MSKCLASQVCDLSALLRAVNRCSNTNQGWFTKSSQWDAAAARVTEPRGVRPLQFWGPAQAPQVLHLLANCSDVFCVSHVFETGSHGVALAGLELHRSADLCPPERWDPRHVLSLVLTRSCFVA